MRHVGLEIHLCQDVSLQVNTRGNLYQLQATVMSFENRSLSDIEHIPATKAAGSVQPVHAWFMLQCCRQP